jgi:hypothetical protein
MQSLSGWDVVIIVLGVLHCVALAYLIIAALMIKNGTVASLMVRAKSMGEKGQTLATQGKHLAEVGKANGPQIAAHLKAIKERATLPAPEGLTVEYAHLQKALAYGRMATGGMAFLKLRKNSKGKRALPRKKAKLLLVERLGLIPPIARPLVRAFPTLKKILPIVIQAVKAQRK